MLDFMTAFGAGTMLAEAYAKSGSVVGISTLLGFHHDHSNEEC